MGTTLRDRKIAFLAAPEGTEESELTHPWQAVLAQGGTPVLVAPGEEVQLFDHLEHGETRSVDMPLYAAYTAEYDALVLPGGVAGADRLRTDPEAVRFVWSFFQAGKPAAVICHAPWLLIEADLVRGRVLTSWPSLHTDITNAGGAWHDQRVVVCENGPNTLVTSRGPADLPAFCDTAVERFAAGGR